jgi:hypothetical protein
MIAADHPPADAVAAPARWQFSTRSLLWLTATAGICLAYARLFGEEALLVTAAAPLMALPLGCLAGAVLGRVGPAVYWALVGALLAAVCAVAAPISGGQLYFWPLLGSLVGALVGSRVPPQKRPVGWLAQTIDADWIAVELLAALIVIAVLCFFEPGPEFVVDGGTAVVAAVALAGLIHGIEWLHRHRAAHAIPRDVWAAGLIAAAIAGNLVARALHAGGG